MPEFDRDRRRDPEFFEENRLAPHSDHICYASSQEAAWGVSSLRYSLNGSWKFFYALNERLIPHGYESADYDCSYWEDICVPAHIQMEGYGVPQYCDVQYPWDGWENPGEGNVPAEFNPAACYVKYFCLPGEMEGKRLFLSVQGAESSAAVWLNGVYIGYSANSFSPGEFELTHAIRPGENKLVVEVLRWSAGSLAEDQDFFRFSGLFRDVYIYAAPDVHLFDLSVRPTLDDGFASGVIKAGLKLIARAPWTVRAALDDGENTLWTGEFSGDGAFLSFDIPVDRPRLWSAEQPFLYSLKLEMLRQTGQTLEFVAQSVGFRRFELKNGLMTLNGKRIVFCGVNRHDFCAATGRALTQNEVWNDLVTMKRNNINAVRTSHYPDVSCFYGMCDVLGLYVMDENNLESHGTWWNRSDGPSRAVPGDKPEYREMMLSRVKDTYERDKNHPCVLIWSCGNEAFGGSVLYEMAQLFRQLDPARLVHYEGISHDPRYPLTSDMLSRMYAPAAELEEYLKTHRDKPAISCEYAHAMGNSCGALFKYTRLAYSEPLYQGGFIWDFKDQAIEGRTSRGESAWFYGGDFGDRPNDGLFCGDGLCYADGSASPKLAEVKRLYAPIEVSFEGDKIKVTNRSLFTNAKSYECRLSLRLNGVLKRESTLYANVPPGECGCFDNPYSSADHPGEYALCVSFRLPSATLWAGAGHEAAFGQLVWRVKEAARPSSRPSMKIIYGDKNIGVVGRDFRVQFSRTEGTLTSYKYAGAEFIKIPPRPAFWRAPTDNDRGSHMAARCGQWKLASMYATGRLPGFAQNAVEGLHSCIKEEEGELRLSFPWLLPMNPPAYCTMEYIVHPDGTVRVALDYQPVKGLPPMPAFGVSLGMDCLFSNLTWYGNGPQECYWDRQEGARLAVWHGTAGGQMARYLKPQECGSHTGVRWAAVCDSRRRGLLFCADEMEFSALPWTPHEVENAAHLHELPPEHSTIIRLNGLMMGLGGDDSWGALPHPEFMIPSGVPRRFVFSLRGVCDFEA